MSARPFSIIDAISDQRLFGQAFRDLSTWRAWLVFLGGLFALPMGEAEAQVWRECTGRESVPGKPFTETLADLWSEIRQVVRHGVDRGLPRLFPQLSSPILAPARNAPS